MRAGSVGSRWARVPLVAVTALLVAAACGGAPSTSNSASGSAPQPLPLRFVEATPTAGAPQITVGVQSGIFNKVGLDVTHSYVGSNIPTLVASGQADIGNLGGIGVISLAKQGKSTTAIWGSLGNGIAAMLFGGSSIASIEQLKAKAGNCKIAALGPGTSNFGWASYYSKSLGLNCKIISYGGNDEQVGALATGQVDASSGLADGFLTLVSQGKVHILIDSRNAAQRKQYMGSPFTDVYYWGLSDWIKQNGETVRRFIKAMNMVDQYIRSHTTQQVANLLHQDQNFATIPVATLKTSLDNDRVYLNGIDHGYVSETDWNAALQAEGGWGVAGFDPSADASQYKNRVDMSYYDKVIGKPKS